MSELDRWGIAELEAPGIEWASVERSRTAQVLSNI